MRSANADTVPYLEDVMEMFSVLAPPLIKTATFKRNTS